MNIRPISHQTFRGDDLKRTVDRIETKIDNLTKQVSEIKNKQTSQNFLTIKVGELLHDQMTNGIMLPMDKAIDIRNAFKTLRRDYT